LSETFETDTGHRGHDFWVTNPENAAVFSRNASLGE
jgi:hypothetical protein